MHGDRWIVFGEECFRGAEFCSPLLLENSIQSRSTANQLCSTANRSINEYCIIIYYIMPWVHYIRLCNRSNGFQKWMILSIRHIPITVGQILISTRSVCVPVPSPGARSHRRRTKHEKSRSHQAARHRIASSSSKPSFTSEVLSVIQTLGISTTPEFIVWNNPK